MQISLLIFNLPGEHSSPLCRTFDSGLRARDLIPETTWTLKLLIYYLMTFNHIFNINFLLKIIINHKS